VETERSINLADIDREDRRARRIAAGRRWVILLGSVLAIVVLICLALYFGSSHIGFTGPNVFLTGAVIATALISFYGFLWHGLEDGELGVGDMRTAITVAVVSVYLVLIALVAFLNLPNPPPGEPPPEPLPITSTLLTSFTGAVTEIVAFYFGATAFVQTRIGWVDDQRRGSVQERGGRRQDGERQEEGQEEVQRLREELEVERSRGIRQRLFGG